MSRRAVLACMTLLASCEGQIGPQPKGELGTIDQHIPVNGIMFFPLSRFAFKSWPLATQTFDPAIGPPELTGLPFDRETRDFIQYTVECALDPRQQVKFHSDVYSGDMGECPSWNTKPPSTDCLEAVTGCLLARQNPYGLRVPFSPRGERPENPSFDPFQVVPASTFDSNPASGLPIASFHDTCAPGDDGEGRNCGWSADTAFTGSCEPGRVVSVGAGARVGDCNNPLGSAVAGDLVLRVCDGMSGCNVGDVNHLGSSNDVCGLNPAVDFTCGQSGVFSVMLSEYQAGVPFTGQVEASSSAPAQFPSKQSDLFALTEGSFYGNMFEKINPNVTLVRGPDREFILQLAPATDEHTGFGSQQVFPFEDAWCCHDPAFDPAYLDNLRACAKEPVLDPFGNPAQANLCMCQPLGECNTSPNNSPSNLCQIYDQAPVIGDVDHDECLDGLGVARIWPTTVFLHARCDMVGGEEEGKLCQPR